MLATDGKSIFDENSLHHILFVIYAINYTINLLPVGHALWHFLEDEHGTYILLNVESFTIAQPSALATIKQIIAA